MRRPNMLSDTTIPDASTIAEEAFVLAYPLVLLSRTMAQATAVAAPDPETMRAPVNALVHARDTPDTLQSSGWLDLAAEPIVLSVMDTFGRYYVLWLHDAWNTVFASVGARTTGTAAHAFAVVGPGHHYDRLPPGLTAIQAPTRTVHVAGCIEAVGEPDDEACERAAQSFALMPLSSWLGAGAPARPPAVTARVPVAPAEQVERLDARAYFSEVSRLVGDNPPDLAGRAVLDRLHEIGTGGSLAPALRASLERGVERGRAAVRAEAQRAWETLGRWRVRSEFGRHGADHLRRARAARSGLRGDPAADALQALLDTDTDDQPLTGACRYVLRFAPDATPPVDGFWSLTARAGAADVTHSIGDLRGLALDPDGSLPIYIQHRPPARKRRSNWLPAPPQEFSLALDLYWPREEALQRQWWPPPVTRVQ